MRLLLVEDYPPLQKSVAKGLREAGFAVDLADNGDDGLWFALHNDYDVIILDLMLPGMDGMSILRRIRQEGRETYVLILTARDAVADRARALRHLRVRVEVRPMRVDPESFNRGMTAQTAGL